MQLCGRIKQDDRTFHNDDGVLANCIIQAIQNLVCTLDLPELLIQGPVLHISHLTCTSRDTGFSLVTHT